MIPSYFVLMIYWYHLLSDIFLSRKKHHGGCVSTTF
uniref:Uncharacterized protein n=1 Tax=Anguilla anguilla TaxID=7936 RepID=A0A0E9TUD1_ANGAN